MGEGGGGGGGHRVGVNADSYDMHVILYNNAASQDFPKINQ